MRSLVAGELQAKQQSASQGIEKIISHGMKKKDVWNVFKGCSLAFFGYSFYHIYHVFTGIENDGVFFMTLLLEARLAGNYVAS